MRKRVSIKDVAREAGVSVTTTSYVLSGKKDARISAETARIVRETAERLHYVPRMTARTYKPEVEAHWSHHPSDRLKQPPDVQQPVLEVPQRGTHHPERPPHISGTGPIRTTLAEDGCGNSMASSRDVSCSFVETGTTGILSPVGTYVDDHYFPRSASTIAGTRHEILIDNGHTRIAFVSEALRDYGVHMQRFLGYQDALKEAGIELDEKCLYTSDVSYHGSYELAPKIVARGNGETAAFVTADIMALGLINGFTSIGVSVPDDISVIGFDDVPLATMCLPQITTVHQDVTKRSAADRHRS